jgi:hypothetical protein
LEAFVRSETLPGRGLPHESSSASDAALSDELRIDVTSTSLSEPPAWLRFLALATAAGVLTFGAVGLVLAVNGWYRPALAFPLGAIAFVIVMWLARDAIRTSEAPSRAAHVVAILAVCAVVAITAWNAAHSSQHVIINRDGGSYLNTGRWIARDGSLEADIAVGPFARDPSLVFDSFAVYEMPNGTVEFQFAHLLPAVLAEAHAIAGNRGLTHAPSVLGGIALLAFFVLAWRLFRQPLFALSAMLALALIIPQVSFTRDSYSELPLQLMLFTAAWLLTTPRVLSSWRVAAVAGLFIGILQAVRIDATVILLGVPPLLAFAWLRADASRRRETGLAIAALVVGILPGFALGLVDLLYHSGTYWDALWHHERRVFPLLGLTALASVLVAALWPYVFPFVRRLPWKVISTCAAVLVAVVGFAMWFVRPHLQELHGLANPQIGALQTREGSAVDATRRYFEFSMHWMSWYLGPLTVTLAIIGAALLVRALLRGRLLHVVGALTLLVPTSMLYLYRASAFPDHVWVTRRFLINGFPTLVLLGVGLAAYAFQARARGTTRTVVRSAAVVVAVAAVAYPLYTVIGLRAMSEKRGFLAVVDDACEQMGPDAAVLVLDSPESPLFDDWTLQTLRGFCGVDVARSRDGAETDTASLRRLSAAWAAEGRPFYIVSNTEDAIRAALPDADITATIQARDPHTLTQTLTHRPHGYRTESFQIVMARVEPS